jgi:lysophospholipase L1-like esterase
MSKWKIVKKKQVIFSIISAILFFVFLELTTRAHHLFKYGFQSQTKRSIYADRNLAKKIDEDFLKIKFEAYPYLMYRVKPNQHYSTINVNSLGFRGQEIQFEKPKDIVRIVMLGGSALWGTGVSSDFNTISAQLEKKLNELRPPKKFQVINTGDSGYVTAQELIVFYDRALQLKPDIVITFDGYNDLYAGFTNRFAGYPQNFQQFKEKLEQHNFLYYLSACVNELLSHSLFIQKLKNKIRIFISKRTKVGPDDIPVTYVEASEIAAAYGRNLEFLDIIAKAYNVRTLYTLQPVLGFGAKKLSEAEKKNLAALNENVFGYSNYLNKVYPLFLEQLNRLKKDRQAKILDLTDIFNSREDTIFIDGVHFSDLANEMVAQRIYETLIKEEIIK